MEPGEAEKMVKSNGGISTGVYPFPSPGLLRIENNPVNLNPDRGFVLYNILGNVFEVTPKYKPPNVPLGKGAYGIVCSARNSETNEDVAIKKIVNAFNNKTNAKGTLLEIKLLRHLNNHENVVEIKDIILPPQRNDFEDVYIVYELMDLDLNQVIRSNQQLSSDHYKYILYQILRGLKYIHSANVLHRDLKPSNILMNVNNDLKICDFGLARATSNGHRITEYVGTRWYCAPEILLTSSYTSAIDVWSVGCIFMELMNRRPLFPGKDQIHQLRLIVELIGTPSKEELALINERAKRYIEQLPSLPRQSFSEKFPNVPPLAIDLMEKMLTFDSRRRISVEEALAHPYLESLHDITDEPNCTIPFSNIELEQHPLTVERIKELIYYEALDFNPEYKNN